MDVTMLNEVVNLSAGELYRPGDQISGQPKNLQPYLDNGWAVEGHFDITDRAASIAYAEGLDITEIEGTGADGRILVSDVEAVLNPDIEDEPASLEADAIDEESDW